MKKNSLLVASIALGLLLSVFLLPDGSVILAAVLMAGLVMGALRMNPRRGMRMTRWGKENPGRARVMITTIQLLLMVLGLTLGYNLYQLDVVLSNSTAYVFTAIMVTAFLAVPFLPKRGEWVVPVDMERRRMSYLAISLASFAMMVFVGNRVEGAYPDHAFSRLLNRVDQFLFNDAPPAGEEMLIGQAQEMPPSIAFAGGAIPMEEKSVTESAVKGKKSTDPSIKLNKKAERKIEKAEKKAQKKAKREVRKKLFRMLAAGGTCALAVLLIILLLFPLCGGICLIIGGLSGDVAGGLIVAGLALAGLSIWGMIAAGKWCKKSQTNPTG